MELPLYVDAMKVSPYFRELARIWCCAYWAIRAVMESGMRSDDHLAVW